MTAAVPVFDCHVLLRKPATAGEPWRARCANAASVTAEADSERAVLQAIVSRFKFFVHEHRLQDQPVPWTNPETRPDAGEVERWIPVHL